jgi:hypothetical protein
LGSCVLVTATGAHVEGSVADSLRINDNFDVEATTRIRWCSTADAPSAWIATDADVVVGVAPPGPVALLPIPTLEQVRLSLASLAETQWVTQCETQCEPQCETQ